jgi:hypothetical protein
MSDQQYEVLSPWAEVDPIPIKGITPRIEDLNGKTIGLFHNDKRATQPLLNHLEKRLKERFPEARVSRFSNTVPNLPVVEQPEARPQFEQWIKEVDTVAAAYGD